MSRYPERPTIVSPADFVALVELAKIDIVEALPQLAEAHFKVDVPAIASEEERSHLYHKTIHTYRVRNIPDDLFDPSTEMFVALAKEALSRTVAAFPDEWLFLVQETECVDLVISCEAKLWTVTLNLVFYVDGFIL